MKKVAALIDNSFEEMELLYPVFRLQEEGHQITLVGPADQTVYKGKNGYSYKSQISYKALKAKEFDAILIPGGFAPDRFRRIPEVLACVREMDQAKKPIAFICHGGWVPISAKILQGKKATGTTAIKDDLENAGAIWVDEPVVIDGHLISSRTPVDLPQFGRALVEALK
ncbi:type 1 glutamine amidotransferase domain-containing protein [Simkania sp.]|uniref:type 1 glutamine amidotransferase domain-containing protein n=1 Tax=Simkania sp. TaxID=34094 RepID=UPI003B52D417